MNTTKETRNVLLILHTINKILYLLNLNRSAKILIITQIATKLYYNFYIFVTIRNTFETKTGRHRCLPAYYDTKKCYFNVSRHAFRKVIYPALSCFPATTRQPPRHARHHDTPATTRKKNLGNARRGTFRDIPQCFPATTRNSYHKVALRGRKRKECPPRNALIIRHNALIIRHDAQFQPTSCTSWQKAQGMPSKECPHNRTRRAIPTTKLRIVAENARNALIIGHDAQFSEQICVSCKYKKREMPS